MPRTYTQTFEKAIKNTQDDISRRMDATEFAIHNYARRAEQHMKTNRPWNDRTGEARRLLSATAEVDRGGRLGERGLSAQFRLAHGVPYGRHLEYGMGGRFAILRPTAELFSARMRRRFAVIWRGTGRGVGVDFSLGTD